MSEVGENSEENKKSKNNAKPKSSAKKSGGKPGSEEGLDKDSLADTRALDDSRDLLDDIDSDETPPEIAKALANPDVSERSLLVVDEPGQRRHETVSIIKTILPNATVETADDPEEALQIMQEGEFDTYVVNFLMPGYSSSQFVKEVCNHDEHPLLIGFAADKMSDAVDPKKGLKIIPLKRLFELDAGNSESTGDEEE